MENSIEGIIMKIEIDLPDEDYKKLKKIFEIFEKDLDDSLQKTSINFIEDSLDEIKSIL